MFKFLIDIFNTEPNPNECICPQWTNPDGPSGGCESCPEHCSKCWPEHRKLEEQKRDLQSKIDDIKRIRHLQNDVNRLTKELKELKERQSND